MQRLDTWIHNNPDLRTMIEHGTYLAAIQEIWAAIVPQNFVHSSKVANLRNQTLVVLTQNGSVASKLKLLSGRLIQALQENKVEVNKLVVRVHIQPVKRPHTRSWPRLSATAAQQLREFARTLPRSKLQQALRRLATRSQTP